MASKAQALATIAKWHCEIDTASSIITGEDRTICIDTIGRKSFGNDCRGCVIDGSDMSAGQFWDAVINRIESEGPYIRDCPHTAGECEFHDDDLFVED